MGKLYVAYGSNLSLAQMAARCPSATIFGVGQLNNWELLYRGRNGNAHATIAQKRGESVPVLVWNIKPADEHSLDIYEGYPHYYYKRYVMVSIGEKVKRAMVYIMDEKQRPGRPSSEYVGTIYQGYIDNGLDISILENSLETNFLECL